VRWSRAAYASSGTHYLTWFPCASTGALEVGYLSIQDALEMPVFNFFISHKQN